MKEDLKKTPNDEVSRNIERASLRVTRLEALIEGLLIYARVGATQSQPERCNLHGLMSDIAELLPRPAGLRVILEIPDVSVSIVRTPLETVLRNLSSNACQHHDKESGEIRITARMAKKTIDFTISDDGPGIDAPTRSKLFKLGQTSRNNGSSSSGFGLVLAQRITEAHGGQLALLDATHERGTTFTLKWPRDSSAKFQ